MSFEIRTRGKHLPRPLLRRAGRWERSTLPPTNLADHLFPGNAIHVSMTDLVQTMVEFNPLSIRKRHTSRLKAIPKLLKKREPLLLREIIDVEGWFPHTVIMSVDGGEDKTSHRSSREKVRVLLGVYVIKS